MPQQQHDIRVEFLDGASGIGSLAMQIQDARIESLKTIERLEGGI